MIQFLKNLFLKDLLLKVISLALAVALWATVSMFIEKTRMERGETMSSIKLFQDVPVSVGFSGGDATGFKVKPATVDVFVRGTPEAIEELNASSVQASVDLAYWDSRENLPVPVRITSPAGTAWVNVSHPEVEVVPPEPATQMQTEQ